jgi:glycosyltransferase involved in cell wall biosynthesis
LANEGIVFFVYGDFPEGNGANSRIKAIAHALQSAGKEVLLCFIWASSFNNSGINSQLNGVWENIPYQYINRRIRRPKSLRGKIADSLTSYLRSFSFFISNHRKFAICYFYSPTILYFWPLILLAKIYRKKIVFEQTELMSSFRNAPGQFVWRFFHRLDERFAHRLCDHMVVISKNLYTHYREYFPKQRLSHIPIIVNLKRFSNDVKKKKGLIGYIGSFGYKDGVDGIINAFEIAQRRNSGIRLRLIGYCENFDRIKKIIAAKRLQDKVELSGLVMYNDVPRLLEECELLVMNRINTKYAHYGSPTKLAEYLASGAPTIITNVGDVKDYLTHNVDTYIIPPENDHSLAEAILCRFDQYEKFNAIGLEGRNVSKIKFSHEEQLKSLILVIGNLLKERKFRAEVKKSTISEGDLQKAF